MVSRVSFPANSRETESVSIFLKNSSETISAPITLFPSRSVLITSAVVGSVGVYSVKVSIAARSDDPSGYTLFPIITDGKLWTLTDQTNTKMLSIPGTFVFEIEEEKTTARIEDIVVILLAFNDHNIPDSMYYGQKDVPTGGGGSVAWDDVLNKPPVIAAASTKEQARATIGAGTSDLTIGTSATTAKIGKPAVIAAGNDQSSARATIGAGTSNLAIGTTVTDVKAGNYAPAWSELTSKPAVIAAGVDQRSVIGAIDSAGAISAMRTKPQIAALTALSLTSDIVAVLKA